MPGIRAILVNRYTFSIADYFSLVDEFAEFDSIILGGNWNGYTEDAKEQALKDRRGLFVCGEFVGSLNIPAHFEYVQKDDKGKPVHFKKTG